MMSPASDSFMQIEQTMSASKSPPLKIRDLTVAYHRKPVIWDIDLSIPEGKLVSIVGPNGAGKSTLIKACLELIPRSSGEVSIYGQSYKKARKQVGYVPQRESVDWDFPVSALDVVAMGTYGKLGWFRRVSKRSKALSMEALERVGLADYAHRQISQLSGGQQQRTFLARALVQDAEIYFMDEPFAAVDAATERAIVELLKELQKRGKTVLVVRHDLPPYRSILIGPFCSICALSRRGQPTRSLPKRISVEPTAVS